MCARLGVVNGTLATAPVPKRDISADHSAEMRKMCHTLVSAENSAEQLKEGVKDYEHDRRHRNRRNQQDDSASRKKKPERQKNSENGARRAHGGIDTRRCHHRDH